MTKITPCKFSFDMSPAFEGYALGSEWNGFDNVAVTPDIARQIADYFSSIGDFDTAQDITSIAPGGDGLVNLSGGYATQVIEFLSPETSKEV